MGKVNADINDLSNITIYNKTQKYEKVTSHGGYFSLKVAVSDSLLFKSDLMYEHIHVVTLNDFETDLLHIQMIPLSNMLKEVEILKTLDAVEFGLLSKPAKKYTVAERRLNAASSGPISLIVNSINGERKMYKKLIGLEKQTAIETKLLNLYGRYDLSNDFDLPEMYLDSFSQYACRYSNVLDAVQSNNIHSLRFILIDIANTYKKEFNIK